MSTRGRRFFLLKTGAIGAALVSLATSAAYAAEVPFSVKSGLFDQTDTIALGLSAAKGTETFSVFKPSSATDHYSNGVVPVGFKGNLYCMWQSSAQNEDSTDTWVAFSRSADGKTWSAPAAIAKAGSSDYKTSGGWLVNGDTLVAFVNVWPSSLSPEGGFAYFSTSTDGTKWSSLKQVTMSDGSVMNGILEQDPHQLADGRIVGAAHLQPGLLCNPIYTDDRSGVRGWKKASYTPLAYTGTVTREIEPSLFRRADSALVMVFRDQLTNYRKLAAVSKDRGASWTTAVGTDMPDSRAKQSAGNLLDGTAFQVNNPVETKRRSPLVVELSKDGSDFDKAFVLRKGSADLQAQRYAGKYKGLGYSYPKSTIWNGFLWVGYATNKEDVQVTRVPLSSIQLNDPTAGLETEFVRASRLPTRSFAGTISLRHPGAFRFDFVDLQGRIHLAGQGRDHLEVGASLPAGVYRLRVQGERASSSEMVVKWGAIRTGG